MRLLFLLLLKSLIPVFVWSDWVNQRKFFISVFGVFTRIRILQHPNTGLDKPVGPSIALEDVALGIWKQVFSWKKNAGRESQGACRQEELIGGKPPVVK
jgi:hypothetical protein